MTVIELASVREEIAGSAPAIWEMLTDFGHPQRLAPTIDHTVLRGEGVGAVRTVHSSRGLQIHEKLLECDTAAYRFSYAILDSGDMPFAHVTSYRCTILLWPLDDARTEIHWRSEGTVDGPLAPITEFLTALYRRANAQIAGHIA